MFQSGLTHGYLESFRSEQQSLNYKPVVYLQIKLTGAKLFEKTRPTCVLLAGVFCMQRTVNRPENNRDMHVQTQLNAKATKISDR